MDTSYSELRKSFEDTRGLFVAFGDRYRQDIIVQLCEHTDMTVRELAEAIRLSRPATSHHIKILKEAGMLIERKEGAKTYYRPALTESLAKIKYLINAADEIIK